MVSWDMVEGICREPSWPPACHVLGGPQALVGVHRGVDPLILGLGPAQ
jgi:hypothetical protein